MDDKIDDKRRTATTSRARNRTVMLTPEMTGQVRALLHQDPAAPEPEVEEKKPEFMPPFVNRGAGEDAPGGFQSPPMVGKPENKEDTGTMKWNRQKLIDSSGSRPTIDPNISQQPPSPRQNGGGGYDPMTMVGAPTDFSNDSAPPLLSGRGQEPGLAPLGRPENQEDSGLSTLHLREREQQRASAPRREMPVNDIFARPVSNTQSQGAEQVPPQRPQLSLNPVSQPVHTATPPMAPPVQQQPPLQQPQTPLQQPMRQAPQVDAGGPPAGVTEITRVPRQVGVGKIVGFLVSYDVDEDGEVYPIRSGRWLITSRRTDHGDYILMEDDTISPLHAILRATSDGRLQLLDQLSEYGTAIRRAGQAGEIEVAGGLESIVGGDVIRLGKRNFTVITIPTK